MFSDSHRVALAHHWLTTMRGGEKVLAVLAEIFPDAPIYTLLARHAQLSPELATREIRTSCLQHLRFIPDVHRRALPLLPCAAKGLDAREYDVVICSDAANIKAIRTRPDALKICYCHSPIRYIWDLYDEYLATAGPLSRLGLRLSAPPLRRHDYAAAQTVTAFIANSRFVADRIRLRYNRPSVVIPPPVNTSFPQPLESSDDFYLVVSELVAYKRNHLAIEACNQLRVPLVVIGGGPLLGPLCRLAGPTVRMLGWQSDDVVRDSLRRCKALLFCGVEDFGMVPVEVQAAGRPVIAFADGGALETVIPDRSGILFDEPGVDSLANAIQRFERVATLWSPDEIQSHARTFSIDAFTERFLAFYQWCLDRWVAGGPARVRGDMIDLPPDSFFKRASA